MQKKRSLRSAVRHGCMMSRCNGCSRYSPRLGKSWGRQGAKAWKQDMLQVLEAQTNNDPTVLVY